mmetsp:Transcript_29378/g.41613  ORF Transcript_29378/g.41613 Transcript_29378/m.41613 type:complete len:108 (+) Transcript_29378:261-584(+)
MFCNLYILLDESVNELTDGECHSRTGSTQQQCLHPAREPMTCTELSVYVRERERERVVVCSSHWWLDHGKRREHDETRLLRAVLFNYSIQVKSSQRKTIEQLTRTNF